MIFCMAHAAHGLAQRLQILVGDVAQGQTQGTSLHAHQVHGCLDGDGVDLDEQGVDQVHIGDLKLGGILKLSLQAQMGHLDHDLGDDVAGHRDDPLGTQGHHRDHLVVVAGPDVEVIGAEEPGVGQQGEVAGGLLHAVDLGILSQHLVGLGGKGDPGAAGHVVEDHRQLDALRGTHSA